MNYCAAPFIPARESLGQWHVFAMFMFYWEILSIAQMELPGASPIPRCPRSKQVVPFYLDSLGQQYWYLPSALFCQGSSVGEDEGQDGSLLKAAVFQLQE